MSIEDDTNDFRWRNYLQWEERFSIRWISAEPLLSRLPIENWAHSPDWIVFGGESDQGQPARPCNLGWISDGIRRCRERGIVPFVKQLGSNPRREEPYCGMDEYPYSSGAGTDPSEWPESLRVREFPKTAPANTANSTPQRS